MEKVIRDGKVAVLIGPGYGTGWSTANIEHQELFLFSPKLVELVEEGRLSVLSKEEIEQLLGVSGLCLGGTEDVEIVWVPQGTRFYIYEYDGFETIIPEEELNLVTA